MRINVCNYVIRYAHRVLSLSLYSLHTSMTQTHAPNLFVVLRFWLFRSLSADRILAHVYHNNIRPDIPCVYNNWRKRCLYHINVCVCVCVKFQGEIKRNQFLLPALLVLCCVKFLSRFSFFRFNFVVAPTS